MGISDNDINEQPSDDALPGNVAGDADGTDGTDGDGTDGTDGDAGGGSDMDGTDSDADAEDAA